MNLLTWFLYLADVLVQVQTLLGFTATIIGIMTASAMLFMLIDKGQFYINRTGATLVIIFGLAAALIPSKTTMYLMGASEVSYRMATMPEVTGTLSEANELLREYIRRARTEIESDLKKTTKETKQK